MTVPGAEYGVFGCGGRKGEALLDELAFGQVADGGLDSTLGKAGSFGDFTVAHAANGPSLPEALAPQESVDQERGRLLVVAVQVAEQSVEYVVIETHGCIHYCYISIKRIARILRFGYACLVSI